MHQNLTYNDLVDRYLKGNLSEAERSAFEEKIQQDPLLANEMSLQQDIYHALGETRKAALKNRLNQIPVHHSPWTPWQGFRTAAVVGTLLLAGIGYYYVDSRSESAEIVASDDSATKHITYPKAYTLDHNPTKGGLEKHSSELHLAEAETTPAPDVAESAKAVTQTEELAPVNTGRELSRTTPTIVRPEVVSEFAEDDPSINYNDFIVPEKQSLRSSDYQKENVAIETLADSDYDFHYQFYDNKLYLHGEFYGLPYKIIALNTETDKKLFLEFNDAYYRIGEHHNVVPLVEIKDSTLVKSLRKLSRAD